MRLELENISLDGERMVTMMEHGGVVLHWNCKLIEKASYDGSFNLFEQINGFWARMPRPFQDRIFEIYQRIYYLLENMSDSAGISQELYELVAALYEQHELDSLRSYIYFHTPIIDPPNLEDVFTENNDNSKTRERTYTRPEYHWLVTLAVALRPMIPIWGEFINRTKSESGTTWKEYKACQLLAYTKLWSWGPMIKLQTYVEAFIPTDKLPASAIVEGLSSEDYPQWLLALVLVRRLCLGDITWRDKDANVNLVSFIHRFIAAKIKGQDNSFGGAIKEKNIGESSQEGENNVSRIEAYKIKEQTAQGDIAIIAYPLENIQAMAARMRPGISPELVEACRVHAQAMSKPRITDAQMVLMQNVLADEIPVPGLFHIKKELCLEAMALTQAVLWDAGYKDLAALVGAKSDVDDGTMHGAGSRSKILKEQEALLDSYYPHSKRLTGKANKGKRNNPASESIEDLASQFADKPWRLNLPQDWIEQVPGNKNSRSYMAPLDLRVRLADLALAIATRSLFKNVESTATQ